MKDQWSKNLFQNFWETIQDGKELTDELRIMLMDL